jgi:hypothetical protein
MKYLTINSLQLELKQKIKEQFIIFFILKTRGRAIALPLVNPQLITYYDISLYTTFFLLLENNTF